jgi:hypothetical protein
MVAFMLESLVLRGSVLRDSVAVSLRLGIGAEAQVQTPQTTPCWQGPLSDCRTADGKPDVNPGVGYPMPGVTPGAGRSRRQSTFRSLSALACISHARRLPVSLRGTHGC